MQRLTDITRASQFRALSTDSRKLVQRAIDAGWTAKVTKRGHVILRAPDGVTTECISKDLSKRCSGRDKVISLLNQQEKAS